MISEPTWSAILNKAGQLHTQDVLLFKDIYFHKANLVELHLRWGDVEICASLQHKNVSLFQQGVLRQIRRELGAGNLYIFYARRQRRLLGTAGSTQITCYVLGLAYSNSRSKKYFEIMEDGINYAWKEEN